MIEALKRFRDDETGTATVEYALLLAVVVVAGVAAWQQLGNTIQTLLEESTERIAGGPD